MVSRNKKRKNSKKTKNKNYSQKNNSTRPTDYNLKRDLNKVNQSGALNGESSVTSSIVENSKTNKINSDVLNKEGLNETQTLLSMSDRFTDKLESLRKDVHSTNEKIGSASDTLRLELEGKIDKKTSNSLFYGAIASLVAIATVVYYISYSGLQNKVDTTYETTVENKQEIKQLNDKSKHTENAIEKLISGDSEKKK